MPEPTETIEHFGGDSEFVNQVHLNAAKRFGVERALGDNASNRGGTKESFIGDLMVANAEAQGHEAIATSLKGGHSELAPSEQIALEVLNQIKQIMATEDRRLKFPTHGALYRVYKSPKGQDASEAVSLVVDILGLIRQISPEQAQSSDDGIDGKIFVSPWHVNYGYEGRLDWIMSSIEKREEKHVRPQVQRALEAEHYDDLEEVSYLLEGPKPLWVYEMAARQGTLDELIIHNGLLKAVEEKAYRDALKATKKSVYFVESRKTDKKTGALKQQEFLLEIK